MPKAQIGAVNMATYGRQVKIDKVSLLGLNILQQEQRINMILVANGFDLTKEIETSESVPLDQVVYRQRTEVEGADI